MTEGKESLINVYPQLGFVEIYFSKIGKLFVHPEKFYDSSREQKPSS